MKPLKPFELLIILVVINLVTLYSFVIGPVQQIQHPLPGQDGFNLTPPTWGIWVEIIVFIASVILLAYNKKVIGGLSEREIKLLFIINRSKGGWKIKFDKNTRKELGFDKSQLWRTINNKLVSQKYVTKTGNRLKLTKVGRSILKMRS